MKIAQFNVPTAYLNGIMDAVVYMEKPELLEEMLLRKISEEHNDGIRCKAKSLLENIHKSDWVCKLNNKLDDILHDIGNKATTIDPCVYSNKTKDQFLLIYVDDILATYRDSGKHFATT